MKYLKAVFSKLNRKQFFRDFKSIGKNSGFGDYGTGEDCTIVGKKCIEIGNNSWFRSSAEVIVYSSLKATLKVGNNVQVGPRCRVTCAREVIVEDNVLIAPEVFITDHNHGMNPEIEEGYAKQDLVVKPVRIGDGTWIGQRACILPGVTIGRHCIIGAGSVCTRSIPDYSMAVGVPARIIKQWDTNKKQWQNITKKNL